MKLIFSVSLLIFLFGCSAPKKKDVVSMVERIPMVEELLAQMTLEEKVGQMTQITLDVIMVGESLYHSDEPIRIDSVDAREAIVKYGIGSILNTSNNRARSLEQWHDIISQIQGIAINETRLGIPIVYGVDAIHGTTYTAGATFFPQQIGQAATWNRELVRRAAEITAYETRASNIPWNFSPVSDIGRDPRWPRVWETFGEDVFLTSELSVAMVKGYEGENNDVSDPTRLASCLKHFLGYSVPVSGKDRTPALIPEIEIRERHVPPFEAAIKAGAHSVMLNSGLINGVPVHASYELVTDLLKRELGFTGLVLTDWRDIENLHTRDRVATSHKEAIKLAINAGVDMSMVPYYYIRFADYLVELVNEGAVPMARIDDAVRRILNMKYKLGLFDRPVTNYKDFPLFGSPEFVADAYSTAKESITLLKNEGDILPLNKNVRVLVSGPNSNSMRSLNGGWSYSWQGNLVEEFAQDYSTILEAIQTKIGGSNVVFREGVRYINDAPFWVDEAHDIAGAVKAAAGVDYIILALGENSYCEKMGDLNDLTLSENQLALAKALAQTGKPIILILNQGRPRVIRPIVPLMKGIINSYLPGNFGGLAIADVIFGDVNPSGKLPFTYPMYSNSLVTYDHKPSENQDLMTGVYSYESDFQVQWSFGFGLSYTTFSYTDLVLSSNQLKKDEAIQVSVNVTNTGTKEGMEVVQLYTSDLIASITPDQKRLRGFEKINLAPGEVKKVTFTLVPEDLSFINVNNMRVTEPGDFTINVGGLEATLSYIN